jgi:hypothetical protein
LDALAGGGGGRDAIINKAGSTPFPVP